MHPSWLYQLDTLWIVIGLAVAMALAGEIGSSVGQRWQPRTDDARRGHIGSVLGSLLGLLALLLGFTFAMSANRYDLRRQLVVSDANALGGLYLLSSLLPEESRRPFKQSLRKYVNLRSQVALFRRARSSEEAAELSAEAEALHSQMWKTAKDSAVADLPPKFSELILKGLIEALSIHRARMFGWESRVPDPVVWLLLFGALTAITVLGFIGGLGKHRGLPARIAVSLLLCGTIYVTLDLDKPHQGLIKISQTPMLHLKSILDGDPEAKP
jgi:hypothetical protein